MSRSDRYERDCVIAAKGRRIRDSGAARQQCPAPRPGSGDIRTRRTAPRERSLRSGSSEGGANATDAHPGRRQVGGGVSGAYAGSAGGPDWGPLERAIAGEVAVLGWPAFDRVPRPFDARYHDPLPRTVVLCAAPADVAETLAFLGAHSLEPAIRSDGHCFAGHSSTSGVIVDVSAMRAVSIDGDLDDRSGATPFAASMASRSKKDRSAYRGDVAAESRSLSIPQRPGTSSMATCASQITRGDPEESGRHARPQAYTDDRDSRFEDPDGWKSSSALDFESAAEPMEKDELRRPAPCDGSTAHSEREPAAPTGSTRAHGATRVGKLMEVLPAPWSTCGSRINRAPCVGTLSRDPLARRGSSHGGPMDDHRPAGGTADPGGRRRRGTRRRKGRATDRASDDGWVRRWCSAMSGRTHGGWCAHIRGLDARVSRHRRRTWDLIPGSRGCTPEACAFRDHHADLARGDADVDQVLRCQ
jgi:hypothetical protein